MFVNKEPPEWKNNNLKQVKNSIWTPKFTPKMSH